MSGYSGQILLVFVLILLNAVFAGSEMALVTLRESQLQRLERTTRSGKVLAKLARDPNRFLATIQIGITLAGFLASAAAAVSLAEPLIEPLSLFGSGARPVAIVIVTLILTFFTLVLGELAPKRIAMQRAETWALLVARPLDLLATLSRPAVWVLGKSSDIVVRMTGGDPDAGREEVSPEEIRDLVAAQRGFTPEQRTIISGAFEITDRIVKEIIVPRREVMSLPRETPTEDALRTLLHAGHSRAPVTGPGGLDDVFGVVHLRDLVHADGTVAEHAHDCVVFPETLPVADALRQLRATREHLAAVADEYGSISGIITLEDLVEEVIGEIYDESDRDVLSVVRNDDGTLILPGTFPLHDMPDIGIDLDDGEDDADYTTIAGLVLAHLGHIPTAPGETVELPGFTATVGAVDNRAITKVTLRLKPVAAEEDD
ncbi:hemolysin family protein [Phytomonospora endophytica]|uniref:Putative hemolysin n=1 Tax=Phytomonospora endophytica TaxID=714109 RepID=A0A841G368_9ACTN|nr:hemolysin family protein [Phytomonospora endophytica]MBB6038560.1 putative hemolysin [Phytomonospora endophytica]GIG69299.1 membrane protein [Phytomonospora endophytica]